MISRDEKRVASCCPGSSKCLKTIRKELDLAGKTVAVVGASADRTKFGNKAVRAFHDAGWMVFPIHPVLKRVEGLPAYREPRRPARDLARPGELLRTSENRPRVARPSARGKASASSGSIPARNRPQLLARAEELGLNVIQACSILGAGRHPGAY